MNSVLLYDCTTGSRAYNLVTPTSDFDHRRIVTPTELAYFFGLKTFDVGNIVTTSEEDSTDYSLRRFVDLLIKNNTVMFELMFAPIECQNEVHPLFRKYFLNHKESFVTKTLYESIRGYAIAEYRRSMGEITRNLGEERKKDIEKYGYSPKNASHCIRLLYSAAKALETGVFPVKLEGDIRDYCYLLKTYQVGKENYQSSYENYSLLLQYAYEGSKLPETPDEEFLNRLLVGFYTELLGEDISVLSSVFKNDILVNGTFAQ